MRERRHVHLAADSGLNALVLLASLLVISGCVLPSIDAGHEGVLVRKPIIFGHGGVKPEPATTGRITIAPTTDLIMVDVRPRQYGEHFDIISAENAPVSFDAFLIASVIAGRSPELIRRFGQDWYRNNVKEPFRTLVREEVQKYRLFDLTTRPGTRSELQDTISTEIRTKVIERIGLPVQLHRVVIGSIMPPRGVLDQTEQTIIQEQRKLTMEQFRIAEEAREKAERQRGIADRAYREHLGLTGPEFVDLRRVEVQKEIVAHAPTNLTVILGLERAGVLVPSTGAITPTK